MKKIILCLLLFAITNSIFAQSVDYCKFSIGLNSEPISIITNKEKLNTVVYLGHWSYEKTIEYGGVHFTYKPHRNFGAGLKISHRVSTVSMPALFDTPTSNVGCSHNLDIKDFCGELSLFYQSDIRKRFSMVASTGIIFIQPISYKDKWELYESNIETATSKMIDSGVDHGKIETSKMFYGTFASVGVRFHILPNLISTIGIKMEYSQTETLSIILNASDKRSAQQTSKLAIGIPISISYCW